MFFDIGKLVLNRYVAESINAECRMFRPHRPRSAAYKSIYLCAADEGLRGRNVLQSAMIDSAAELLRITSPT